MKLALRILSLLITGFSFVNLSPVFRAPEGGQLEFKCKYNCRHKMKNKYVCRTPCNSNSDVIIHSNKPETFTSGGRMSIFDYASECLIKITLTNASLSDAGKYYCGIDITLSLDEYIDVNIEILKDLSPTSAFTVLQSVIRRTEEVLTTRPLLSVPVGLQTTLMSTMESETEFKTEATRNGKAMGNSCDPPLCSAGLDGVVFAAGHCDLQKRQEEKETNWQQEKQDTARKPKYHNAE
ncbi:CMRF35-like molecule 6 isoform X2 [Polypterus senegalus]|uniref:CMRF35-like molecule 6 isoform X2 n=1 Tax=Polypterus senegalus TaxID=55291 RepID=UPI001966A040|nr:CMRF35-like molecule 6 isoform X2 [Polypterus senegalus]